MRSPAVKQATLAVKVLDGAGTLLIERGIQGRPPRAVPSAMARCWRPREAGPRLALLLALLVSAAARPLPKLAQPDYTVYHTKWARRRPGAVGVREGAVPVDSGHHTRRCPATRRR
jgi:hypothetical protein